MEVSGENFSSMMLVDLRDELLERMMCVKPTIIRIKRNFENINSDLESSHRSVAFVNSD